MKKAMFLSFIILGAPLIQGTANHGKPIINNKRDFLREIRCSNCGRLYNADSQSSRCPHYTYVKN